MIIPAHNAAQTLPDCLDGLAREGLPGPRGQVIVVDDGSTDGTSAVASRQDVVVLTGEGRGPGAARNLGAQAATGAVLVFLDADTVPQPGWLDELLRPLSDPQVVAVKGAYTSCQRSLVARYTQLEFEEKYARLERAKHVDFVDTGTAAYRRQAFLATGGFDEGFPAQSAEDVDLAFRLSRAGAQFAFSPRAVVLHRHAESLPAYLTKKARYGYFRLRIYRRFPEKALGDSYTPPIMGIQIGLAGLTLAAVALRSWRGPRANSVLAGALLAFAGTTFPLARRALASDPGLTAVVPPLCFARALAQGLGVGLGLLTLMADRTKRMTTPAGSDSAA